MTFCQICSQDCLPDLFRELQQTQLVCNRRLVFTQFLCNCLLSVSNHLHQLLDCHCFLKIVKVTSLDVFNQCQCAASFFIHTGQNRWNFLHAQFSAGKQSSFSCNQLIVSILHRKHCDWLKQTVLCNAGCQLVNFLIIKHFSWLIWIWFNFIFWNQNYLIDHFLFCKQCFHNRIASSILHGSQSIPCPKHNPDRDV